MGSIVERKPRLFVSNIPPFVVAEDVRSLMGKICTVKEVYIPPETVTGLHRGFAIVELDADMSLVRKCLQLFHNTHWKGAKLRVELAKGPYYKDKLAREKAEAAEAETERLQQQRRRLEEAAETGRDEVVTPKFSGGDLKIRRSMSRFVRVKVADGKPPKYLNVRVFPKLVSFDDDGMPIGNYPSQALINSAFSREVGAIGGLVAVAKEQQGKGVKQRVGFGFEKKPQLKPGNEDSLCCVEASAPKDKTPKNKLASVVGSLFQSKIEDDLNEFAVVRAAADGEEDNDEDFPAVSLEPAVSAEEVTDAALDAERRRLLSNLQRLLQRKTGDSAAVAESTEGGMGADQSAITSGPEPVKRARAPIAKGLSAWNSITVERYDPTEDDAGKFTSHAGAVPLSVSRPAANASSDDPLTSADNFANLDVLKGIFTKETGGVQFSSGGLKQDGAVVGHRSAQDTLFLEAEKWGFDVRMDDNKASAPEAASGTQMSFNFFGDDSGAAAAALSSASAVDTLPTSNVTEAALVPTHMLPIDLPVFAPVAVGILSDDAPRINALSMADVIAEALKFRRQIPLPEIHDRWLKNRDKLTIDYKRKRKESRKKAALAGGKKLRTEDLIAVSNIGNTNNGLGNRKFGNRNGGQKFSKKRGGQKK